MREEWIMRGCFRKPSIKRMLSCAMAALSCVVWVKVWALQREKMTDGLFDVFLRMCKDECLMLKRVSGIFLACRWVAP